MPEDTPLRRQVIVRYAHPNRRPRKVRLTEFPEEGSYIGLLFKRPRPIFVYCPMNADGSADSESTGTIDNVDDSQEFVDKLNSFFGTDAKVTDFPGR